MLIVPEGHESNGLEFIKQGGTDFIGINHFNGPYFQRLFLNIEKHVPFGKNLNDSITNKSTPFETILDALQDPVTIWNANLVCVYANAVAKKRGNKNMVGMALGDQLKTPEGIQIWSDRIQSVFQTGKRMLFPDEVFTSPEGIRSCERALIPIADPAGMVTAVGFLHRNTTEKSIADEEIRKKENLYRAIVEDQIEFVSRFSLDFRLTYVNSALCRYIDKDADELLGMSFLQWIAPEDREKVKSSILGLSSENSVYKDEQRIYGPDGSIRWQEWTNRLLFSDWGDPLEYQAIGRDITDKKIAEELLRESEAKYRAIFNEAAESIVLVDAQTREIVEFNNSALATFGYEQQEFAGMPVFNLAAHRNPEITRQHFARVLGEGSEVYETQFLRKDRQTRHVIISAHSLVLSGKLCIIAIIHDITERKKMEEDLAREKTQLCVLLDNLPDQIYYKDLQGRFLLVNKKMMEDAGAGSLDEIIGKTDFDFVSREIAELYLQEEQEIYSGKKPIINSEQIWLDQQHAPHVLLVSKIPISDTSGQPLGLVGISRDITQFREAEKALRQSEERFRQVMEVSFGALYHRNLLTGACEYTSPACERHIGFTVEEMLAMSSQDIIDRVWPAHREKLSAEFQAMISEPFDINDRYRQYEYLWQHKNGTYRWLEDSGVIIRDNEGKPIALIGNIRDITDKKISESRIEEMLSQIEKSRDDMLSILDQLRIGVLMIDEDDKIIFVSQQLLNLLSRPENEVLGQSWKHAVPLCREDQAKLEKMAQKESSTRSKVAVHMELRGRRHHWMEVDIHDDPRDPRVKITFLYDVSEIHDLRRQLDEKGRFQDLIGRSKPMRTVYEQIQEVSQVDWTVLIEGETGTGKELVARAIHFSSPRKDKPFIALNCAGLTDSLLASQLFGHKKGAFTGASENHQGLFEAADGGTLFLDEIGDIPMNVQTSLLRVLQEKEITRLGESKPRKTDVRVLAATNRDLNIEVANGNFRLDLLYRVRITRIHIPPLRARVEDISLLVGWFLGQCRAASGKTVEQLSPEAMRALLDYAWPGNVRELQNAIEYAVIRCPQSVIQKEDLPPEILTQTMVITPWLDSVKDEKERLLMALTQTRGNRKEAANLLGISRATFYRRLDQYGITDGNP